MLKNAKSGCIDKGDFVFLHVGFFFSLVFGNRLLSSVGQMLEWTSNSTLSRNSLSLERSAVSIAAFYTFVLFKVLGFLRGISKKSED